MQNCSEPSTIYNEEKNLMEDFTQHYVDFIILLRKIGITVSIAESLDGFYALENIDILQMDQVKAALFSLLVKDEQKRDLFERAWNRLFEQAEHMPEEIKSFKDKIEKLRDETNAQAEDLSFQGHNLHVDDTVKEKYSGLAVADQERVRNFIRESEAGKGVEEKRQILLEKMVKGQIEFLHNRNPKSMITSFDSQPSLQATDDISALADMITSQEKNSSDHLFLKDLKDIRQDEITKTSLLIKKLCNKINLRWSRRLKASTQRDRLDFKRTMRKNIMNGDVLFELKYKTQKKHKFKVLFICDVSGSMVKYSTFLLQFILGLHESFSTIKTYLFSETIKLLPKSIKGRFTSLEELKKVIYGDGLWGKTTNLKHALHYILEKEIKWLQPDTVVFILSDTKTVMPNEAVLLLKKLKKHTAKIIWINTMPKKRWDKMSSIALFSPYCNMYPCNSLKDLSLIFDHTLSAI